MNVESEKQFLLSLESFLRILSSQKHNMIRDAQHIIEELGKVPDSPEVRAAAIDNHITYLQEHVATILMANNHDLLHAHHSLTYQLLLGGESIYTTQNVDYLNLSEIAKKYRPAYSYVLSPGQELCTNPLVWNMGWSQFELEGLAHFFWEWRKKIYFSFDLKRPERVTHARQFFIQILDRCYDEKIPLTSKRQKQNYGAFQLYTFFPTQLYQIIAEAYWECEELGINDFWLDVEHFLQQPLPGVPVTRVGAAQEPPRKYYSTRHSARMGQIGSVLDQARVYGKPQLEEDLSNLSIELYQQACATAQVLPDKPWELAVGQLKLQLLR